MCYLISGICGNTHTHEVMIIKTQNQGISVAVSNKSSGIWANSCKVSWAKQDWKRLIVPENLRLEEEGFVQGLSQVQSTIGKIISWKVRCLHSSRAVTEMPSLTRFLSSFFFFSIYYFIKLSPYAYVPRIFDLEFPTSLSPYIGHRFRDFQRMIIFVCAIYVKRILWWRRWDNKSNQRYLLCMSCIPSF